LDPFWTGGDLGADVRRRHWVHDHSHLLLNSPGPPALPLSPPAHAGEPDGGGIGWPQKPHQECLSDGPHGQLLWDWLLFWPFLRYFGPAEALWQAAFHSVWSFATAGFDIVGPASFADYRTDYFMLGMLVIILRHKHRGFSLNTKLVVVGSLIA
jgi:hypothetical protein